MRKQQNSGYQIKSQDDLKAEHVEAITLLEECEQYKTGNQADDDEIDAWVCRMIALGEDPFEE